MARKKKSIEEDPDTETVTKIIIDVSEGDGVEEEEVQEEDPEDEEPAPRARKPIEVRAAQLKDEMFCHYTYDHTVAPNTTNEVKCKSAVPIHKDLSAAFARLNPHLAVICDEISKEEIGDIDQLPTDEDDELYLKVSRFSVVAFKLDGIDTTEGVYLIGQKKLSDGDYLKMEAPKKRWDASYPFINELRVAIMDIVQEVEQYMGGKQAPKQQISMFDDTEVTIERTNTGFSLTTAGGKLPKADPAAMKRVLEDDDAETEKIEARRRGRKLKAK